MASTIGFLTKESVATVNINSVRSSIIKNTRVVYDWSLCVLCTPSIYFVINKSVFLYRIKYIGFIFDSKSSIVMNLSVNIFTLDPAAPHREFKMYFFSVSLMLGQCSGSSHTKNKKPKLQTVPISPNT